MRLLLGDCLVQLKTIDDNSIDAVVTDPPYGLAFMGKRWDYDVPSVDVWREVLRVLKPGGHLLSFGGTRTYHRMVVNVEDAGFEIRDQVQWIYGSGFPKSLDVSKAIDKAAGAKGEAYIDEAFLRRNPKDNDDGVFDSGLKDGEAGAVRFKPATDDAKLWQGWGTALKPANEVIVLARKPLTGADVLTKLVRECLSKLSAEIVKLGSASSLSAETQQSIAQWLAGKNTLTPDASSEVTAMLQSESALSSNLNTALSWLNTLDGVWTHANTCTTEMESSLITDLKILRSLLSSNTQASMHQSDGLTEPFNASLVANLLSALELKLNYIHTPFAQDLAISPDALANLRPNSEPIVLARKPLERGLTVAENVLKWGTGAINVDAGRIESSGDHKRPLQPQNSPVNVYEGQAYKKAFMPTNAEGRWPANVLFDEAAAEMLDAQAPNAGANGGKSCGFDWTQSGVNMGKEIKKDKGGASRFFYVAKASKRERNAGLEGMPEVEIKFRTGILDETGNHGQTGKPNKPIRNQNHHPTVKPIKLMEYLIKLITPPGGVVLDPFMGSGSTGVAAKQLGFDFVGCEMNEEYLEIAKRRIG